MTPPDTVRPRSYDETLLTAINPADRKFARTWARALLRDRPEIDQGGVPLGPGQPLRPRDPTWPEFSRTDVELNAALELDAVVDASGAQVAKYYRPHFTAARLYLGDPTLWKSRSVEGGSENRRDALEIVTAWLAQGRAIDALIPVSPLPPFQAEATAPVATSKLERPATVVARISGGW